MTSRSGYSWLREFGGGVHRCAGLVDDGVSQPGRLLGNELRDDFLGLAAGGAVADDDGVDAVFLDERTGELALVPATSWRGLVG